MDGCFVITCFFKKVQETPKQPQSYPKAYPKKPSPWFSMILLFLLGFLGLTQKYRKNECLACKNRASGGGGGFEGAFLGQTPKPQRNLSSAWFSTVWAFGVVFGVALWWLCGGLNSLIFNALQNIKQALDFQWFCSAGRIGQAKQGWVGWCFVITFFLEKCKKP